ncbi:MAG: 2-hydroxychromene-2-carboxylate isomerase [Paraglaciecola psychrophila]|jgi:2-hydroxychromene-2-carboxylate isomerase
MSLIAFMLDNGLGEEQLRSFFTNNIKQWVGQERVDFAHSLSETKRMQNGERRRIDYFHQSDDPCSQLTAQVMPQLIAHYDVDFIPHLLRCPDSNATADSKSAGFLQHCREDAMAIGPLHGCSFPVVDQQPEPALKLLADQILTQAIADDTFFDLIAPVGRALWANDANALAAYTAATATDTNREVASAEKLRSKLGYGYASSFFYGGEWFLGINRINHLEDRLISQGARNRNNIGIVVPRPREVGYRSTGNSDITLEFFVCARNPYSAIVIPRLLHLVQRTGITLQVRPVLPATMRGKDFKPVGVQEMICQYADAGREGRYHNMYCSDVVDCTGLPIKNCYSLFPWATNQGKGLSLIAAFMDCMFFRGVDIATNAGMRIVVEQAGLDWSEAVKVLGNTDWETQIDANLEDMYQADQTGLFSGPGFRLSGGGYPELMVRGQDRLIVLEADIEKRVGQK